MFVKVVRDNYDTPLDFDSYNEKIPHGKMTEVTYASSVTGTTRKCMIYTPPGYSNTKKYNVLYCMHGIGGDHREWLSNGSPQNILDNLYAKNKLANMIVVFPNGRAMINASEPLTTMVFSPRHQLQMPILWERIKLCILKFYGCLSGLQIPPVVRWLSIPIVF